MFPSFYPLEAAHLSNHSEMQPLHHSQNSFVRQDSFSPRFSAAMISDNTQTKYDDLRTRLNGNQYRKLTIAEFILRRFKDPQEQQDLLHSLAQNQDQDVRIGLINLLFPDNFPKLFTLFPRINHHLRFDLTKQLLETSQECQEIWEKEGDTKRLLLQKIIKTLRAFQQAGHYPRHSQSLEELLNFTLISFAQDEKDSHILINTLKELKVLQDEGLELSDAIKELIQASKNDPDKSVTMWAQRLFPDIT